MPKNRIEWYLSFATEEDKARTLDKLYHYKATMGRNATYPQAIERAVDMSREHEEICRNKATRASNGPPPRWSDGPGAISDGAPDVSSMGE